MIGLPESVSGLQLDHVAIAVESIEAASEPYLLLGLAQPHDERVEEQGVIVRMFELPGGRIELLQPSSPEGSVARFLERRGPGLHHVGLAVSSLEAEIGRLLDLGARFVDPTPRRGHGGSRIVFLHPSWTGGVLVELVERSDEVRG